MASRLLRLLASAAVANQVVWAAGPFRFCSDKKCDSCPVEVTDAGTGYPNCVIYSSDDVFGHQEDMPGSDEGGYSPFMDIATPDQGCRIIVRTPASTDELNCGTPRGIFPQATCSKIPLKKTFMVQFCCGREDCKDAGALKRSAKFGSAGLLASGGGGGGGLYLHRADGSRIEPLAEGPPPALVGRTQSLPSSLVARGKWDDCPKANTGGKKKRGLAHQDVGRPPKQAKRVCEPDDGSWEAKRTFTKPSSETQAVTDVVTGPASPSFTKSRSQSWTTSEGVELGFAKVVSLGVSFSRDYGCSITETKTATFDVAEGQSGVVGFTAYLECQTGTYTCGGERTDEKEICVPFYKDDDKGSKDREIAGEYHLIIQS